MWVWYVCIWYMGTPLPVFAFWFSNLTMPRTDRTPDLEGLLFELLL